MTYPSGLAHLRRLAEFDRRLVQLLEEWAKAKRSGRVLLYVDVREGEVRGGGKLEENDEKWA